MAENMIGEIITEHRERMLNLKKYYPFFKLIDTSFSQFKEGRYEALDMGYIGKGFEICINDAAPIVAMTDSLVTLIISVGYADGDDMHIGGMDSKSNHLIWMNKKMSLGDKIKVRVREIDIASPLHMRYPSDREEMKKEYYKLKKKLEEEGKL